MKKLYRTVLMRFRNKFGMTTLIICCICALSCRKFVEIDPPKTSLIKATVFTDDATATATIIDIYGQMINGAAYSSGVVNGLSFKAGLAADELDNYSTIVDRIEYATNNLTPLTSGLNATFWLVPYQTILKANAVLEGLSASIGLTPAVKSRLEGEAKFLRAFAHFYLVNLFGDVPLVLTTDYRINGVIPRTSKTEVYQQIIKDLKDAQNLLSINYLTATGTVTPERKRVNKFAATAMLARVYLYTGDWLNAETEASKVISYTDLYGSEVIGNMFLKNSKEAIWQLGRDAGNAADAATFLIPNTAIIPANGALKASLITLFASGDLRKLNWIDSLVRPTAKYYYPKKYKVTAISPISEYAMVLRLGEQYLIRAEARAHQGSKVIGSNSAESDLNFIRNRAGIGNTSATNEATMLAAIEQERRFELFTEWGHRWLDLKRTNRADAVLGPLKGITWQTTDQLWPIPQEQILNDPAMANQQNPGYN
ncbi:RagB/SusD family nutrient uptake outer membrane protein [Pedobacter heparinus]|uniref:RagB/SusD family nutrient uptake outer membrane protein n=1 Tax=Pedobacter heparinus TaxID=984 RepID=UPI00292F1C20|nr:RagB/SusD family nutrient uptake outer membrane protein [Pedobacter heparinus]